MLPTWMDLRRSGFDHTRHFTQSLISLLLTKSACAGLSQFDELCVSLQSKDIKGRHDVLELCFMTAFGQKGRTFTIPYFSGRNNQAWSVIGPTVFGDQGARSEGDCGTGGVFVPALLGHCARELWVGFGSRAPTFCQGNRFIQTKLLWGFGRGVVCLLACLLTYFWGPTTVGLVP